MTGWPALYPCPEFRVELRWPSGQNRISILVAIVLERGHRNAVVLLHVGRGRRMVRDGLTRIAASI